MMMDGAMNLRFENTSHDEKLLAITWINNQYFLLILVNFISAILYFVVARFCFINFGDN